MGDAKAIDKGNRKVSEKIYFLNNRGEKIRPIYQRDDQTGIYSYRVHITGGNTKEEDLDVHCHDELLIHITTGLPVRCLLPNGDASLRSFNSKDVAQLIIVK